MTYNILILNQKYLQRALCAQALLAALKSVHFESLCRQYGLDSTLIAPAMRFLSIEESIGEPKPFFLLRYQNKNRPPIIVSRWEMGDYWQNGYPGDKAIANLPSSVREFIKNAGVVYSVALEESQLFDLGLLLAYEIARWVAWQGSGLVLSLDGHWYRLNQQQAFISLQ